MMRKALVLALSSVLLATTPVVAPQSAQAASLFEKLFPQAAERRERRKQRRRLRRQRELELYRDEQIRRQRRWNRKQTTLRRTRIKGKRKTVVKAPTYKLYSAVPPRRIALSKLAKPFSAFEQKQQAAAVLRKQTFLHQQISSLRLSLDATAQAMARQSFERPPIRLSAGAPNLKTISVDAKRTIGKAITTHYAQSPQFLWIDEKGRPNAKARAVESVLAMADDYGLQSNDYAISAFPHGEGDERQKTAMQYEFQMTARALRYLHDAKNGVVDPNKISGYHDFKGTRSNYSTLLAKLAKAEAPEQLMLAAHPQEPAFAAMREALKQLRSKLGDTDIITVAPGTFIKPGQTNTELANVVEAIRRKVPEDLRAKHFDVFAVDHSDGIYEPEIVALVRDFQRFVRLSPDGIVGKNTIARMQVESPQAQVNKVLYAMERLRWHPDRLGNTHVFINQPAYRASYVRNGRSQLSMKAIVGKRANQTSFFHDKIEYVEFNPYWGVPRSILVNEMLPKLRRNPGYLDRLGYEITTVRGTPISSYNVDWYSVGADFPFNVRQPPGPKNALGELKIMFPNKHSIYMHDTPARNLFKRSQRALSHGCVRLAEPYKMAAAVLGTSVDHVASRVSLGENRQQKLKRQIPVYVAYFTAWPDSSGKMRYYSDIYGRDNALAKAMAAEHRVRGRDV